MLTLLMSRDGIGLDLGYKKQLWSLETRSRDPVFFKSQSRMSQVCDGQKMGPYVNKWSPLDGAHEQQVTVTVTTSGLS